MSAEQRPHFGLVAGSHHPLENIIVLGLHLPAVADIAAYQEENRQRYDHDHSDRTAVIDSKREQERRHESRTGRNEPAADHGNHTRNAEYGALAAPGLIGQRRTHRHHKGHVSSRKRQLERGAQCDQQAGQQQIDRRTYHIESGTVLQNRLVLIEAFPEPALQSLRHRIVDSGSEGRRSTHDTPGQPRRTEHLVAGILTGQIHRGLDNAPGLPRSGQGDDHHHARKSQENEGRPGRRVQRIHQEGFGSVAVGDVIHIGRVARQRYAHEIHQVVSGEGQCQGESSQQRDYLENIDPTPVEHLREKAEEDEAAGHQVTGIGRNPLRQFGCHERRILHTLDQNEIDDRRHRHTAEQRGGPLHVRLIIESKDQSGDILHHCAEYECDRHRKEDGHDDRQSLFRIQHIGKGKPRIVCGQLDHRQSERTSQQLENDRHGSRSRQPQGIEGVQKNHVDCHDRQADTHDILEIELFGPENPVPGDIHHTVAHDGAAQDTHRSYTHDPLERSGPGADGRPQEIHGIVADTHHQIENRQQKEEEDNA